MTLKNAPPQSSKEVIAYAPPEGSHRKWIRRAAVALVLIICIVIGTVYGPRVRDRVVLLNLQRRCLNAARPPSKIVYDDDSESLSKLLALDRQYVRLPQSEAVGWFCDPWDKFYAQLSPPGRKPMATVFIGERHCVGGSARIFIVEAKQSWGFDNFDIRVSLSATVIEPGTLLRPPRIIAVRTPMNVAEFPVRLFAGQADANDSASLKIRCESRTGKSAIIVRLNADDTVSIDDHYPNPVD